MIKRRRIMVGVLLVAFVFVAFVGIRSFSNSSKVTDVSRKDTIAPTTTGEACSNADEMASYYGQGASYNSSGTQATVTVNNGVFRATSVSAVDANGAAIPYQNLISADPTTLGNLSSSSPMNIPIASGANGEVTIHFVVAESDEKCLSYDAASTNTSGQKVGTYEFDIRLQLKPIKAERDEVVNSNYNGICAVFRTGNGYNDYKNVFDRAGVSQSDINNYNYNAVNDSQRSTYNSIMSYCLTSGTVSFNYTESQTASLIGSAIRIIKNQNTAGGGQSTVSEDFMTAFNDAKSKALALGHDYSSLVSNGSIDDTRFGLTCAWDKKQDENDPNSDYYVNKDYYYAQEQDSEGVVYNYHYTGTDANNSGESQSVNGGSCNRICEEAVVVEYGPPVASKAGLCFEYKVRVTSRVICNSSLNITPPTQPSVCTPTPVCNSVPGYTHQGGPSEDFDACIQECDGGEYSASCSSKCYEEVYESEESIDPLAIRYGDIPATQLSSFPGYAGRYEWQGDSIVWVGDGTTYARWYQENEPDKTYNDHGDGLHKYSPDTNGFKRERYSYGLCRDNCYWTGCSKDDYLNDEDAAKDMITNLNLYNQAVASCQASASCTTKTAEFTIGVDYTDNDGKSHTVDFPIDTGTATLPSHGSGETASPSGTDIFIPDTNELGYAGCYETGDAQNWYQAEWSFPGTWINNKTGEISFTRPSNPNAWHFTEDKFCIPLDAQSVNTEWWEWSEINSSCYNNIEGSIDYNIHASTTDFGYFGWNFDIECFYGLKNEVCVPDGNGCCLDDPNPNDPDTTCDEGDCPGEGTVATRDYAFRIVDLNDLFPEGNTTTSNNDSSLSIAGRQPGYNWTLGISDGDSSSVNVLTSLLAKNPNYEINPLALINDIQERGNSIYSGNDYLDYQITLDTEALAYIRDFNRNNSYTDYGGSSSVYNGVTSYRSDLLNELANMGAVNERGNPGVNNE